MPDPRFTYGYFIEEVETRVGPQRQRVGIAQTFPWFGTIEARTDAAAAAARAARKRYEAEKLHLFYEVKDAYFEYVYLRRAIEIARDDLDLVRHFERVVHNRYVTATAGHPDIIRAQVELATLEDRLETLEGLRTPIVARLNAVLNRSDGSMLPWPEQTPASPADVDRATLFGMLRQQNPSLQAMDFDVESARSRIELAKRRFYPDLSLIDAQQTLLRFRLQYERALADRNQRLAELEMLVGSQFAAPGP